MKARDRQQPVGRDRRQPSGRFETRPQSEAVPERPPWWTLLPPLLLFVAAVVYGFLEVHSSTDTWIGLAAGRQIAEQTDFWNLRRTFPLLDTFSYTFHGTVWYNQNWLSHLFFWTLYDRVGPWAVIAGTWVVCAALFIFVMLAVRVRCGSWFAALLAGAVVAAATRDWVSARPATIQFFLVAALWLCLSSLLVVPRRGLRLPLLDGGPALDPVSGAVRRGRWLPILLLLPLFLIWGNAHGSFIFGYGLVGLFLGCWLAARLVGVAAGSPRLTSISDAQAVGIAAVCAAAALLTVALGPYGIENFTHPMKIAQSEVFRGVSEWIPPYKWEQLNAFPPVKRFWIAFGIACVTPVAALALRAITHEPGAKAPASAGSSYRLQAVLLDVAAVALGVYMAMYARRFAPMLYILAAPALVHLVMFVAPPALGARRMVRYVAAAAALPAAVLVAGVTYRGVQAELVRPFEGLSGYDMLDRVTRVDAVSREALLFLRDNELEVNLFVEWTAAGVVMFQVPRARVFMDGRAQQVYDEYHYRMFGTLQSPPAGVVEGALRELDRYHTDTVMLKKYRGTLLPALAASPRWVRVLTTPDTDVFMRVGSAPLQRLVELERGGQARWPDTPGADAGRGSLWANMDEPDLGRAVAHWMRAVQANVLLGVELYRPIADVMAARGESGLALQYLERQRARVTALAGRVSAEWYDVLLAEIGRAEQLLRHPRE